MVDFTPILTLIITIVPIVLLIAVLAKVLKGRLFVVILAVMFGSLLLSPFAGMLFLGHVRATAQLEPDSGTLMADIPIQFGASGLTGSTAHHVNISVGGSTSTAITSATTNADGELSFSITFTTAGSTVVDVAEGAVGSGSSKVTGNYNIIDFIDMIMPYIVLMITLAVLFGLVAMLTGLVSLKK